MVTTASQNRAQRWGRPCDWFAVLVKLLSQHQFLCYTVGVKLVLYILNCVILGLRDAPPKLLHSSECDFEFEWRTASACVLHESEGDNCRVEDETQGYSFDLTPLRSTTRDYNSSNEDYDFYVNVCESASSCKSHENAAACQKEKRFNKLHSTHF